MTKDTQFVESGKSSQQARASLCLSCDGRQVQAPAMEVADDGSPMFGKGVAKNRRISIEDSEMRYGRKSRSQRFVSVQAPRP